MRPSYCGKLLPSPPKVVLGGQNIKSTLLPSCHVCVGAHDSACGPQQWFETARPSLYWLPRSSVTLLILLMHCCTRSNQPFTLREFGRPLRLSVRALHSLLSHQSPLCFAARCTRCLLNQLCLAS